MVSGDCPVAAATQLRSHPRISGTDISVRASAPPAAAVSGS
jgi:hypothetical protein